jgi:hypothetical protein
MYVYSLCISSLGCAGLLFYFAIQTGSYVSTYFPYVPLSILYAVKN